MDNDPLVCENEIIPLSSICHDRTRIGYEGAAMLERMMSRRRRAAERSIQIMPQRIEERASTRGLYSDDPLVRRVIDFFGEHLSERTGLPEAAAALGVTPGVTERRQIAHIEPNARPPWNIVPLILVRTRRYGRRGARSRR